MTATPSQELETPVLIVGGGPVGLTLALDLAIRGIRSTLVERDAGTAVELLAKAGTLNERTMEYCRWLGISDAIANVGFPDDHPRDTVYCTSLNGFVLGRDYRPSTNDRAPAPESPEILRKCPQFRFDPLLAKAVQERGLTQIRYGTSWLAGTQDADGVTSTLAPARAGPAGPPSTVRSKYLVACDGAGSAVRRAAGIGFEGRQLDYSVSAMIEVEHLEKYHPLGRAERYMFIGTEGTWANLTAVDGRALWRLTLVGSEERLAPERLDFDAIMARAMGNDRGGWTVRRVMPWRRSQFTADRFTAGRILLAGDAAHTTSPTGGHGLNTGIGDVSDLGWMLDALLRGWGGDRSAGGLQRGTQAGRDPQRHQFDEELRRLGAGHRPRSRPGRHPRGRGTAARGRGPDERDARERMAFVRRRHGIPLRRVTDRRPRRDPADTGRPGRLRADGPSRAPRAARLARRRAVHDRPVRRRLHPAAPRVRRRRDTAHSRRRRTGACRCASSPSTTQPSPGCTSAGSSWCGRTAWSPGGPIRPPRTRPR